MEFYKRLYYNLYLKVSANERSPEILTIGFISICQTFNLITILNLFFALTGFGKNYDLPNYFIGIFISAIIINYYFFENKKIGKKIVKERKYPVSNNMSTKYLIISFVFLIASFAVYRQL